MLAQSARFSIECVPRDEEASPQARGRGLVGRLCLSPMAARVCEGIKMKPLDDQMLEQLARSDESARVERKENFKDEKTREKVREAVCAFANDLPGLGQPGVVFIGLKDDGQPSGIPITDELLVTLSDIKCDGNITPPPTMTVEKRWVAGAELAVLSVWPSDCPPVRFRGRIWVRTGPRRNLASAQDERVLNERRRYRDKPFDVRPLRGATLQDLDLPRFELEYLPALVARDVLNANERTQEEKLAATKLVASADDLTPTVLGLLVLGRSPCDFLSGAYVQFLRIEGYSLADPVVDEARIDVQVLPLLTRLEEKLEAHNRTRVDYVSTKREQRRPLYPMDALRQLVRNAVLHRNYEGTNAPVRVTWYDDRIEIQSPGGPYGEVSIESFGKPGVTDYRNPNLAEAMRALGLVQKFGSGIAIARKALEENGNPPLVFDIALGHVHVIVRKRA